MNFAEFKNQYENCPIILDKYINDIIENNQTKIAWLGMICRCEVLKSDATICDDWFCYSVYKLWYESHLYSCSDRLVVDKDILSDRNSKIYSPKTCLIVPNKINTLFIEHPKKELPPGVYMNKSGKYISRYKGKTLGLFASIEEASYRHNQAAKERLIEMINKFPEIPNSTKEILLNYDLNNFSYL